MYHKESKGIPEKYLLLFHWLHKSLWLCGSQQTGKFLEMEMPVLPASWETCMRVKKQQLECNMEQLTGSKLGKEYDKTVYCYPVYLTYVQSTSCKILGWMSYELESSFLGKIPTTWYADVTTLKAESEEKLMSLLMKTKERDWKS